MTIPLPNFTRRACVVAMLCALPAAQVLAQQSSWPTKQPIRLIVPAPAGGASDMIARTMAESMRQDLKQSVIVENKPGAGGIIAVETMLGARDGYTFVLSPNSLVTEGPYSYKFRFDPFKDLAPIAEVASVPLVLVADPKLPVKNLADVVSYVKAHPGKVSYASYSPGTLSHIKGMQFNKAAGLDMEHVGYKGSPPALTDVMGGQIQFMFDGMGTALPLAKTGKVRALAVTSAERSPYMPDVPTVAEAGYPNLTQIMGTSVWSTPDIPVEIRTRMRQLLLKSVATPSVKSQLAALGMDAGNPAQTEAELQAMLQRENERTGKALKAMNYKPGE